MEPIDPAQVLVIDYTNHSGTRAFRRIIPQRLWFGESEYHSAQVGPQWYLRALDVDRCDPENPDVRYPERDFLFTSIHESMTVRVWEHRAESDKRWRLQQQAWANGQR